MTNLQKLSTGLNPRLKAITRNLEINGIEKYKSVNENNKKTVKYLLEATESLENGIHTLFLKKANLSFGQLSLNDEGERDIRKAHITSIGKNI